MVKKLPYQEFLAIYDKVPRLCVELVLQNDQGILLTKRAIEPAKGYWHLPGGTLLKGESVAEAGVRIAAEELGSEIEMQDLLGFIEYTPEMSAGQGVSLVFQASLKSIKITLNEQASEFEYFNPLPEDTIKETKKFLEQKVLK